MRLLTKLANGVFLIGIATVGLVAGRTHVQPLVPVALAGDVQTLEDAAAHDPSADAIRALASAYLDRNEPGLASAALERAPSGASREPAFAYVEARALYARGHASEALVILRGVETACDANGPEAACPAWLVAKTSRQVAFLEALGDAGVEDPALAPEVARTALERSRREGRVVAIAMR